MSFNVTGRTCVGGAREARLFPSNRNLELTWLDDGSAVVCNHRELTWLDRKPDNAALTRL
jgi:hypothetical protein